MVDVVYVARIAPAEAAGRSVGLLCAFDVSSSECGRGGGVGGGAGGAGGTGGTDAPGRSDDERVAAD